MLSQFSSYFFFLSCCYLTAVTLEALVAVMTVPEAALPFRTTTLQSAATVLFSSFFYYTPPHLPTLFLTLCLI